jgi:hypothetical protein
MSFNKENFFQERNSEEFFFARTNPLANGANAEILKIEDCGGCCDIQLDMYIGTAMGTTTIEFNTPTDDYDTKYVKVQITDGQGNFVTAVGTGLVDELVLDTSGLSGTEWSVIIEISLGELDILGCDCAKKFSFTYYGTALSIDTEALANPILSLSAVGGALGITTLALGTFPDGADIPFQVELHNTGFTVLTVASATPVADVLSATLPAFAGVIFPGNKYVLSAVADGNLGAGAQTGDINFVSDGGSITLTVTWTLTV